MSPPTRLQSIWSRSQRGPGVLSPCIGVCRMDAPSGHCSGCFRSLEEIGVWSTLSDDGRRAVWAQLLQREQQALELRHESPR
jgi:uncharacterized protein